MSADEARTESPATLPLEAEVQVTDQNGTAVDCNSFQAALAMIRKHHPRDVASIRLDPSHTKDQRFAGGMWTVGQDDIEPTTKPASALYTVRYTQYLITDDRGVTNGVQLAQVDAIAQRLAQNTHLPVVIDSGLLGLDSWTVNPILEDAPEHEEAVSAATAAPEEPPTTDKAQAVSTDKPQDVVPADASPASAAEVAKAMDEVTDADKATPSPAPAVAAQKIHETTTEAPEAAPVEPSPAPAQDDAPPLSFAEEFTSHQVTRRQLVGPAEEGWRGLLNRLFAILGLKLKPGKHEQEQRRLRAAVQQGLDGSRTVMVCNVKGGSRKSTTTFALATTTGRVRGGNVLAWDNNENSGNLVGRGIRAKHARTAIELHRDLENLNSIDDVDRLARFMHPQGDNRFDILASQNVAGTSQVIDAESFRELRAVLRSFYSLMFVDTGNASNAETWKAAAENADVVVLTMDEADDSMKGAAETLDALHRHIGPDAVKNAVAVITRSNNSSKDRIKKFHTIFGPKLRAVVEIPYEPALKDGGEIIWETMHRRTQEAYLKATATVVDGL